MSKERQQWFKDRIGKRVFRNAVSCPCNTCTRVEKKGLIINDEMHAESLCDWEGIYMHEKEIDLNYRDKL